MRRALALLTSRVLRTRFGTAVLLIVVIAGIVGAAQLFGSNDEPGLSLPPDPGPVITASPGAGDDGEAVAPSVTASAVRSEAEEAADAFAAAWLNHRDIDAASWLANLRPHCTDALAKRLAGVDPATVPADHVLGTPEATPQSDALVEVTITVNTGLLRLNVIAVDRRWLVDSVDWERQ